MKQPEANLMEFRPAHHGALMTDLYELTMAAGYHTHGHNPRAVFELFVRKLSPRRSYLLAAGLEQALAYLENLRFTEEELSFLKAHPSFRRVPDSFFDYLRDFRFTGDVWAAPEGSLIFSDEPLLQVEAPLIEAQVVETYLLSMINFQTMIATKASRVAQAAAGRPVVDFGTRRAHGPEAGVLAARACFLGGCTGTANVQAGMDMGIPTFGTIAHSWIMSFPSEAEAFRRYAEVFPDTTTFLIDTYDVEEGARAAARFGALAKGVRIDSGDLDDLSRRVRSILDDAGCHNTRIVASSDLNEFRISELVAAGAPIDSYGVGTEMVTSADAPSVGGVYKLVAQEGIDGRLHPAAKFSPGKATLPGPKQVFRFSEGEVFSCDMLGLRGEPVPSGAESLLVPFMKSGKRLGSPEPLPDLRSRALRNLSRLPGPFRDIQDVREFPVALSPALVALRDKLQAPHAGRKEES